MELVTVGVFSFPHEAELAKSKLEAEGVPAYTPDANLASINWLYSGAIGGVKLQVADADAEHATEILHSSTLACPECALLNSSDAATCASCGYSFQENPSAPTLADNERRCESCRAVVERQALECEHCGHILDSSESQRENEAEIEKMAKSALTAALLSVVFLGPLTAPTAISRGSVVLTALNELSARNPDYQVKPGIRAKAVVAIIIGVLVLLLWFALLIAFLK